jgi:hypothetical protein
MSLTQISVFIENKPGHLQKVLKTLGDAKINIITITIAETADFGILRMIVNSSAKAYEVLHANNITCSTTEVLALEIDDVPGALCEAIGTFSKHNLNIEYMYTFNEKRNDKSVMVFRFENFDTAQDAVKEAGYTILSEKETTG